MISSYIKLRNKNKSRLIFLIILGLPLYSSNLKAQEITIVDEMCSHPLIKTRLLYQEGTDLSMPVLNNRDEQLELRFDYLGEPELDFAYSIVKCRYNWEVNDRLEHEYLDGFNEVGLYDSEPSRNTTVFYTHYHTEIPGEDMRLLQSGNYALVVHDAADRETVYFTKRFAVAEETVSIDARINRPDYQNQELMLKVHLGNLRIQDPLQEVKVIVVKNYDWNHQVQIQRPPLLRDNTLHYDMPFQIITPGNNEYRDFDAKNVRYIAPRVDSISYLAPEYHFYLTPDKMKPYEAYFHNTDMNGRSYIDVVGSFERHTEADYVNVHFSLVARQPLGSDVYVYGALTDWITNEQNYMNYNLEKGHYEATLQLKQGLINYAYATRNYDDKKELLFDITEGSHDETENDYQVFVYLSEVMSDFDKLVGYKVINSTNK